MRRIQLFAWSLSDVMSRRLSGKARLAFAAAVLALGGLLSWYSGIGFAWALLIAIVAVLVNGFIATPEDELPGGFNNPDGTVTPRYADTVSRIVRWTGGLLTGAVALGALTAVRRGAMDLAPGVLSALVSILLGLALITRRRLFQWAVVLMLAAFAFATSLRDGR